MAISNTTASAGPFVPNGVTTAFPYSFATLSASEIVVVRTDAFGAQTTLTGWTATYGVAGGTVTFAVAPIAGDPITILASPSFTQQTDFQNQGAFLPATINTALDRAAVRAIYLKSKAESAVSIANGAQINSVNATNTANGANINATAALTAANIALASSANLSVKTVGGAVADGVTNDTAAVSATNASAQTGVVAFTPGTYLLSTTPTVSKPIEVYPGATLTGAGAAPLGYTASAPRQTIYTSLPNQFASQYVRRNATHTGGTAGFTSAAFRADSYVSAGNTNYEWTATFLMDTSATGGQNVASYSVGIKRAAGPTWGAVIELKDKTTNPTAGSVGLELDMSANGTDINNARVGLDLAIRKDLSAGADCVASWGYRIQNGGDVNSLVKSAYGFASGMKVDYAFDASQATCTYAAFKLITNQNIIFSADNVKTMNHTGGAWSFNVSGVSKASIADSGAILVGANQVIGSRGAAVADATDAASAITQLNLLLARLRAATGHGLIA